jgi:hypothetical protein
MTHSLKKIYTKIKINNKKSFILMNLPSIVDQSILPVDQSILSTVDQSILPLGDKLDVHYYDGRIELSITAFLTKLNDISLDVKKQYIMVWYDNIKHALSLEANNVMQILINDMGTAANYDITNQLSVDDLLYIMGSLIDNHVFIEILNDELIQMAQGFCSQGRTHRLLQIIVPFI